ncbi:elongation factor P [Chlamydiota bacterium]
MISTNNFKTGITILIDKELFTIENFQHVKPGKGGAFVRTRLRNVKTGNVLERTFNAGENFEQAFIETKKMEYLYFDSHHYVFMDIQSYEQIEIEEQYISEIKDFLKENILLTVTFYEGSIIEVMLPNFMELEVTYTEPGFKGDTATSGTKPATVETGALIQVPLFVNTGDTIKIDTRTRQYLQRV